MFFNQRTENGKPYLLTLLVLVVLLVILIVLAVENGGPVGAQDSFPPNIHVAAAPPASNVRALAAAPAAPNVRAAAVATPPTMLDPAFGSGGKVITDFGSGLDHAQGIVLRQNAFFDEMMDQTVEQ